MNVVSLAVVPICSCLPLQKEGGGEDACTAFFTDKIMVPGIYFTRFFSISQTFFTSGIVFFYPGIFFSIPCFFLVQCPVSQGIERILFFKVNL